MIVDALKLLTYGLIVFFACVSLGAACSPLTVVLAMVSLAVTNPDGYYAEASLQVLAFIPITGALILCSANMGNVRSYEKKP